MRVKIIISLVFVVIAALFVVSLVLERYDKRKKPHIPVKISKTQAISLAKEAAAKEGYKVEEYNFGIEEDFLGGRPCWTFFFELKRKIMVRGGLQHFGVWVDKETGQTEIVEVRISKTQAISLAKQAALRAGYKVEEYNFRISQAVSHKGRPQWSFYFKLKHPIEVRGGLQYFDVWVDEETGETKVFGGM